MPPQEPLCHEKWKHGKDNYFHEVKVGVSLQKPNAIMKIQWIETDG